VNDKFSDIAAERAVLAGICKYGSNIWIDIEEKAMFMNSDFDYSWPCDRNINEPDLETYPYPLKITNWDIKEKTEEQILSTFQDKDNFKFNIPNENLLTFTKQDKEFDPNKVEMFRISLISNEHCVIPKIKVGMDGSVTRNQPFKEKFLI